MPAALQNFPIDIVVFAVIAAVLALRLRSVLGKRVGAEPVVAVRPERRAEGGAGVRGRMPEAKEQPGDMPAATLDIPAPATRVGQVLAEIAGRERGFAPRTFLTGAEVAFRGVLKAFAAGDRTHLKAALTHGAYQAFDQAIAAREAAGEVQRSDVGEVMSLAIEDAAIAGAIASISVRIVSMQVNCVLARDGVPVSGTESVTEFSDLWRFERLLGNTPDSVWRLAEARAA